MPPRKTPRQKAIKKLVKKVAKKVAKDPKVANAKNPKKKAKKLVKKILPKVLQKAAVPKKDVKKLIKKAKQVVKKKTAPAGKRGLVANQEQTQNKGGRKRKRKRQGAGKWAKHGCKVTQVLFCTICLRALTAHCSCPSMLTCQTACLDPVMGRFTGLGKRTYQLVPLGELDRLVQEGQAARHQCTGRAAQGC